MAQTIEELIRENTAALVANTAAINALIAAQGGESPARKPRGSKAAGAEAPAPAAPAPAAPAPTQAVAPAAPPAAPAPVAPAAPASPAPVAPPPASTVPAAPAAPSAPAAPQAVAPAAPVRPGMQGDPNRLPLTGEQVNRELLAEAKRLGGRAPIDKVLADMGFVGLTGFPPERYWELIDNVRAIPTPGAGA